MRCVVRFMHPKLFRTRREWSYSARQAVNTNGTSTLATSPPSGGAAASFARNSSIELSKRISATPRCRIFCSIGISRRSLERRSVIGGSLFQQLSSAASPFLRFLLHSLISIAIAKGAFLLICCRRSATSLAHTLTNAWIGRGFFTPNGSNPIKSRLKNQQNLKRQRHITPGNREARPSRLRRVVGRLLSDAALSAFHRNALQI